MAQITSKAFTINVNRATTPEEDLATQVIIYKGVNELTPVNRTPSAGEYQVSITSTKNCTAKLQSDNKTIKLLSVSSSTGRINIAINVENVKTYNKTITVASIISNEVMQETIVKQSQLEQNLDGFKTTVSETYATQSTTNNMLSQIQQNANSISTKVNVNGIISAINQSAETIAINAGKINLNGYVSNDEANWSIDTQGNMETKNMNIEGDLSADTITCNTLNSPKYPGTLDGDIELFVNSSSGNDDAELDDGAVYKTVQGALDALPKLLNGKTAHITMQTNSTEDVYLKGFVGGVVRIYMNGKALFGTFRTYVCSAAIYVYGGTKDSTEGATGIIHPNVGLSFATRSTSVGFESSQYGALYKVKVFAPDTNPSGITST